MESCLACMLRTPRQSNRSPRCDCSDHRSQCDRNNVGILQRKGQYHRMIASNMPTQGVHTLRTIVVL
eukprot:9536252-Prorocentrum_lima.AAC.1